VVEEVDQVVEVEEEVLEVLEKEEFYQLLNHTQHHL
jgi:hypothetical protein